MPVNTAARAVFGKYEAVVVMWPVAVWFLFGFGDFSFRCIWSSCTYVHVVLSRRPYLNYTELTPAFWLSGTLLISGGLFTNGEGAPVPLLQIS